MIIAAISARVLPAHPPRRAESGDLVFRLSRLPGRGVDLFSGVGGGKKGVLATFLPGDVEASSGVVSAGDGTSASVGDAGISSGSVAGKEDASIKSPVGDAETSSCVAGGVECLKSPVGDAETSSSVVAGKEGASIKSPVGDAEMSSGVVGGVTSLKSSPGDAAASSGIFNGKEDISIALGASWPIPSGCTIIVCASISCSSDASCACCESNVVSIGGVSGNCMTVEASSCASATGVWSSSSGDSSGDHGFGGNAGIGDFGCMRRVRSVGSAAATGMATADIFEVSSNSLCVSTSSGSVEYVGFSSRDAPQLVQNCALVARSAWQWVHWCIRCSFLLSDA